mmetsp:Transcript_3934/g.4897  ORF Transcript_3934/g.4897 Transcript_3934/m.4897 type:complete len:93 (-) Transcript_3934:74-352(-)
MDSEAWAGHCAWLERSLLDRATQLEVDNSMRTASRRSIMAHVLVSSAICAAIGDRTAFYFFCLGFRRSPWHILGPTGAKQATFFLNPQEVPS